ncbi:MAG TPA: hypothetical protein VF609_17120 [Flavisolibacter sp.]
MNKMMEDSFIQLRKPTPVAKLQFYFNLAPPGRGGDVILGQTFYYKRPSPPWRGEFDE